MAILATLVKDQASPANILQASWVSPDNPETEIMLIHSVGKLDQPKKSPLDGQLYAFSTSGQVKAGVDENFSIRFRVFAQSRKDNKDDIAQWSTRMLLRMWSYIHDRLRFDHSQMYRRFVDVYLSETGKAGGETVRSVDYQDQQPGRPAPPVNVITLFQVDEYKSNFQLARELAHEYGHAVISPFGPFEQASESWANGDIGERLFLTWFYQDIKAGRLQEDDIAQADLAVLEAYVNQRVNPLVDQIAASGPDPSLADNKGAKGFDQVVALAAYAQTFLSARMLGQTLRYPVKTPGDYSKAILDVCSGREDFVIEVPARFRGKAFYIPAGSGKITGAKVLGKKGSWVKVQPSGLMIGISNK